MKRHDTSDAIESHMVHQVEEKAGPVELTLGHIPITRITSSCDNVNKISIEVSVGKSSHNAVKVFTKASAWTTCTSKLLKTRLISQRVNGLRNERGEGGFLTCLFDFLKTSLERWGCQGGSFRVDYLR